tara:strand:- start:413 stop:535 length:123 start_codon:yes stop_codon:yes gene_type:complete
MGTDKAAIEHKIENDISAMEILVDIYCERTASIALKNVMR